MTLKPGDVFSLDLVPIETMQLLTLTVQRGHQYSWCLCYCGRRYQGVDHKRVREHYHKHAKRCTSARKWKRAHRHDPQPELFTLPDDYPNGYYNTLVFEVPVGLESPTR